MTSPEERIAQRMRQARESANLTQMDVARQLRLTISPNFSRKTYERWERLESYTFMRYLDEIAAAIGTTTGQLLAGENVDRPGTLEDVIAQNQVMAEMLKDIWLEVKRLRDDVEGSDA